MVDKKCAFIKAGHPGCAIGCLPGFRKAVKGIQCINDVILRRLFKRKPSVAWFGRTSKSDAIFLDCFLDLHDDPQNWHGKTLRRSAIVAFAKTWKLKAPANPRKKVA